MKNNNKKMIILIFVSLVILLLSISIIIVNNTVAKTEIETNKEKNYHEIEYIESEIMNMIGILNNISRIMNFYIDWNKLQIEVKSLYSYWNSAILDFNNLEIEKKYLTDFGKDLDNLIISINNNDRDNTIDNLIRIYNKLIIYSETLNYGKYTKILVTKINLLTALSIVEKENWTLIHEYILKASEAIFTLVNSLENNAYNQYNINQAYIAIKELENLINIKDIELFYFKYKNAIEHINKVKVE